MLILLYEVIIFVSRPENCYGFMTIHTVHFLSHNFKRQHFVSYRIASRLSHYFLERVNILRCKQISLHFILITLVKLKRL